MNWNFFFELISSDLRHSIRVVWMWRALAELTEASEITAPTNSDIAIDTGNSSKDDNKGRWTKGSCRTLVPQFFFWNRLEPKSALCNDSDKKQFMQKEKEEVFIQIYARILFIVRDNGTCWLLRLAGIENCFQFIINHQNMSLYYTKIRTHTFIYSYLYTYKRMKTVSEWKCVFWSKIFSESMQNKLAFVESNMIHQMMVHDAKCAGITVASNAHFHLYFIRTCTIIQSDIGRIFWEFDIFYFNILNL